MSVNINDKKGFSLIEVTLALVVLSAGVIGILFLLNRSLDATISSTNKIQATVFADSVFSTLCSYSYEMASKGSNEWKSFWLNLAEGESGIPVACPDIWFPSDMLIQTGTHTLVFSNNFVHAAVTTNTSSFAVRYTMEIELVYTDDFPYRVQVSLKVSTGEFEAKSKTDEVCFYSEYFYKSMP
jgi:hypothetical protein